MAVRKRGKVWQYEISYKKQDGTFAKARKSGFKSKKLAIEAENDVKYNLKKGHRLEQKDITLYEYFKNWYHLYKKGKVATATEAKYENHLSNIDKYMPYVTIQELNKNTYQKYLNEYGLDHAKESTKEFNGHIRACLKDAIDDGLIVTDPTRKAVMSGHASKKDSEKFIDLENFSILMKETESNLNPNYASRYMIILAGATGMRFGELLGLTWNDIDFEMRQVDINKAWDYKKHTGFINTKNYFSERKITINPHVSEIFKNYQKEQRELFAKLRVTNKNQLIFYNPLSGPISNNAANKTLVKLCAKIDCTGIKMHGLRHTHASILLYKDVSIYSVARRLGHKNIKTTQKTYAHIIKELEKKDNERIAGIMDDAFN